MGARKRLKVTSQTPGAVVKSVRKPKVSRSKDFLSSLPPELQLDTIHHLPLASLATICQLSKFWRCVGTDELLRRLLPITPRKTKTYGPNVGEDRLRRAMRHFIDINNADALQRLLDFKPNHAYFHPTTTSLLLAEPESLRVRVTKDEEQRFFLAGNVGFSFLVGKDAMKAAFRYNDMSCLRLLIDHGLADYSWLLDRVVDDSFCSCLGNYDLLGQPLPGRDLRAGRISVLKWLLAYPPRHVVQAMLVMWGWPSLYPSLQPQCDWWLPVGSQSGDNMLIVAVGRGHPASLQTIEELRLMLEILTDDHSGGVIPEAHQPLLNALRIARGLASIFPGTRPLVADYLQSFCTWADDNSSSISGGSSNNTDKPPPPPARRPILPRKAKEKGKV